MAYDTKLTVGDLRSINSQDFTHRRTEAWLSLYERWDHGELSEDVQVYLRAIALPHPYYTDAARSLLSEHHLRALLEFVLGDWGIIQEGALFRAACLNLLGPSLYFTISTEKAALPRRMAHFPEMILNRWVEPLKSLGIKSVKVKADGDITLVAPKHAAISLIQVKDAVNSYWANFEDVGIALDDIDISTVPMEGVNLAFWAFKMVSNIIYRAYSISSHRDTPSAGRVIYQSGE